MGKWPPDYPPLEAVVAEILGYRVQELCVREYVHLISNLVASFPRHIAHIVMHNRTVNIRGKPGRGKPIDQFMEHCNL